MYRNLQSKSNGQPLEGGVLRVSAFSYKSTISSRNKNNDNIAMHNFLSFIT